MCEECDLGEGNHSQVGVAWSAIQTKDETET